MPDNAEQTEQNIENLSILAQIQEKITSLKKDELEQTRNLTSSNKELRSTITEHNRAIKETANNIKGLDREFSLLGSRAISVLSSMGNKYTRAALMVNKYTSSVIKQRREAGKLSEMFDDLNSSLEDSTRNLEDSKKELDKLVRNIIRNPKGLESVELELNIEDVDNQIQSVNLKFSEFRSELRRQHTDEIRKFATDAGVAANILSSIKQEREELENLKKAPENKPGKAGNKQAAIRHRLVQLSQVEKDVNDEILQIRKEQLNLFDRIDAESREAVDLEKQVLVTNKESLLIEQKIQKVKAAQAATEERRNTLLDFSGNLLEKAGVSSKIVGGIQGGITTGTSKWASLLKLSAKAVVGLSLAFGAILLVLSPIIISFKIIIGIFKKAAERLESVQAAAISIRKEFGALPAQVQQVTSYIDQNLESMQRLGISADEFASNIASAQTKFGFVRQISKDELDVISQLNGRLGISGETAAGMLETFNLLNNDSRDTDLRIASWVASLAAAGMVAPSDIMGDISENAEDILTYFRGTDQELVSAAISARQLGLSINKLTDIASNLLDFESSISAEMEASVLIGKQLDLSYARRLAFMGETEELGKELFRIVSDIDFENMNPIAMKSLSAALGLSVVEMRKMVTLQNNLSNLTASTRKDYEMLSDNARESLAAQGEFNSEDIARLKKIDALQTTQQQISNEFATLFSEFAKAAQPAVSSILDTVKDVVSNLRMALSDDVALSNLQKRFQQIADVINNLIHALFDPDGKGIDRAVGLISQTVNTATWFVKSIMEFLNRFVPAANLRRRQRMDDGAITGDGKQISKTGGSGTFGGVDYSFNANDAIYATNDPAKQEVIKSVINGGIVDTVKLITNFEGFSSTPYRDHRQWSIGYGTYAGDLSRNPTISSITRDQAKAELLRQLPKYESTVDKYDSIYKWRPGERAALTSFAYNVGSIDGLTAGGTRTREQIANKMPEYNKASGQVNSALVDRREIERAIFMASASINSQSPIVQNNQSTSVQREASNRRPSIGTVDNRFSSSNPLLRSVGIDNQPSATTQPATTPLANRMTTIKAHDALIRPDQNQVVKFDPKDTIFATKNPMLQDLLVAIGTNRSTSSKVKPRIGKSTTPTDAIFSDKSNAVEKMLSVLISNNKNLSSSTTASPNTNLEEVVSRLTSVLERLESKGVSANIDGKAISRELSRINR